MSTPLSSAATEGFALSSFKPKPIFSDTHKSILDPFIYAMFCNITGMIETESKGNESVKKELVSLVGMASKVTTSINALNKSISTAEEKYKPIIGDEAVNNARTIILQIHGLCHHNLFLQNSKNQKLIDDMAKLGTQCEDDKIWRNKATFMLSGTIIPNNVEKLLSSTFKSAYQSTDNRQRSLTI